MVSKILLKAIKPFRLLSLVMAYALGAGLVQYVHNMRSWKSFVEGGLLLLFFSLGMEFLRLLQKVADVKHLPEGLKIREIRQIRIIIAIVAATLMTVIVAIIVGWMVNGILWQGVTFLVIAAFVVGVFYYLCNLVLSLRPYQLLIEAFLFVIIPPAIAFYIQSQDPHPFLAPIVLSLVPAYLAYRLVPNIKAYAADLKSANRTIVMVIGWDRAMVYHNALILLTFLLFALTALLIIPWFLIWPVFLTLPIGLMEIWLMERVRKGGKPLWLVMKIATASVYFLPIYLLAFAFWVR